LIPAFCSFILLYSFMFIIEFVGKDTKIF